MLECLILGDSIAKGISDVRKECVAYVQSGINSYNFLNKNVGKSPFTAQTVVISLGSNDYKDLNTFDELNSLRQLVAAERVIWILPNIKETKRNDVWHIAKLHNDFIIDARAHDRSKDTVHPTYNGYKTIATATKN
jgi:hypothetical protein